MRKGYLVDGNNSFCHSFNLIDFRLFILLSEKCNKMRKWGESTSSFGKDDRG